MVRPLWHSFWDLIDIVIWWEVGRQRNQWCAGEPESCKSWYPGTENIGIRGSLGGVSCPVKLVWDPGLNRSLVSKIWWVEVERDTQCWPPIFTRVYPQALMHLRCEHTHTHTGEAVRSLRKMTGCQRFSAGYCCSSPTGIHLSSSLPCYDTAQVCKIVKFLPPQTRAK